MAKELCIKTIKKELMDAFLGDMRIINTFTNKNVKKVNDYIGTNIFSFINDDKTNTCVDTYISYDVMKSDNCFIVSIVLRVHKDLLRNDATNCMDDLSDYIEEIVNELYPYHKSYSDVPNIVSHKYARRNIRFTLCPDDAKEYEKTLEDEEEFDNPGDYLNNFFVRAEKCIDKCEKCSYGDTTA